ncbi:variant erythrocyte surface antigen-1 family protein [Babesia caballi]|uniref:Variant erythrocyte surface antigen-1 family protein n=1 Tax=Babesia caballi TaxID=5871 RepID=A0AAV4LRL5_BABCB|nr:variant erythrocyte surface antigen-1 family protein [Babesia caballi]
MTSGDQKKSLTQAPENLKEAIDWVLRVSGGDQGSVPYPMNFVKTLHFILNTIPHTEDDFRSKALKEIKIDENAFQKGFIYRLAEGLQTFIGYEFKYEKQSHKIKIEGNGIVKSGEIYSGSSVPPQPPSNDTYTTAYGGSRLYDEDHKVENAKKKAVQCFFTAIQFIFEGLTELYYDCRNRWSGQSLSANSEPNQFMQKNGFDKTKLKTTMTGATIATQTLQSPTEFQKAHTAVSSNPSLDSFRSQLEQGAMSNTSDSPLSALYTLATYAYFHSTSPASPSFAGYSGLDALGGGAYGLNLGGLGTFMSALLA